MEGGNDLTTNRKRGAQPGNKNALKHGFYAQSFAPLELEDLKNLSDGLIDEISLLRVCTRRLFEISSKEVLDLEDMSMTLNSLGSAAVRLSHLLRIHKVLTGKDPELAAIFSDALSQVVKELGIKDG